MNEKSGVPVASEDSRAGARVHGVKNIHLAYEGEKSQISLKSPDLSERGMFINTTRLFPEGAILNLQFRLAASDAEIDTRCEVRYCLPGMGIGVEFISLSPEAERAIQREIAMSGESTHAPKQRLKKKSPRPATKLKRRR